MNDEYNECNQIILLIYVYSSDMATEAVPFLWLSSVPFESDYLASFVNSIKSWMIEGKQRLF